MKWERGRNEKQAKIKRKIYRFEKYLNIETKNEAIYDKEGGNE